MKLLKQLKNSEVVLSILPIMSYITALVVYFINLRLSLDFILVSIILLDIAMLVYLLKAVKRHIVMFVFICTFNVLILSRVFTKWITEYDNLHIGIEAGSVYNMYLTFTIIFLSLECVYVAYRALGLVLKKREDSLSVLTKVKHKTDEYISAIKVLSLVAFGVCFCFAIYSAAVNALFVLNIGYLNSYLSSADIPYQVRSMAALLLPAFTLFLATKPTKKQLIIPTSLFMLVSVVSLATGRRNAFVKDMLLLLIYALMRDDVRVGVKKIFTKVRVGVVALAGLVSVYILQGMRSGFSTPIFRTLFNFVYDQGASIRIVAKTVVHKGILADNPLRYFFYPLEVQLRNGFVGNLLFNLSPIVEVQTEQFVLTTYNYAHKLTYLVDPQRYLAGGGFGASFVADGYILFGIAGVIIIGLLLGAIIRLFPSLFTRSVFTVAIGLAVIRSVVYLPRNFFFSIVTDVINLPTAVMYGVIFLLAFIYKKYLVGRSLGKGAKSE